MNDVRRVVVYNRSYKPPQAIGQVVLDDQGDVRITAKTPGFHNELSNGLLKAKGAAYLDAVLRKYTGSYIRAKEEAATGKPRMAAISRETALHKTADSFVPKLEIAVRLAFALGRKALNRNNPKADTAVKAIRKSLEDTLPKILRKVYVAGGQTGVGMLRTAEFREEEHPRDDAGKFTSGAPQSSTTSDDDDAKKYLTPGEFEKLPPGIRKWKIATRKAKAEAAAKGEEVEKKAEKPKTKEEAKSPEEEFTVPIGQREKAINVRTNELAGEGKPYHEASKQARQEDEDRFGPLPASSLTKRNEAIQERYAQLLKEARDRNNQLAAEGKETVQIKSEKLYNQAKIEDVDKWGPWVQPEEKAARIQADKHWSVQKEMQAKFAVTGEIKPREPGIIEPEEQSAKATRFKSTADDIARQMGHDPKLVAIVDRESRTFSLNGRQLQEGGHYDPITGFAEINVRQMEESGIKGVIVHEIQHAQWDFVKARAAAEEEVLRVRWSREQNIDFRGTKWFTKDGKVLAKYRDEIEEHMPYTSALARAGLGSKPLGIKPDREGMRQDDGVSSYSREYWAQYDQKASKRGDSVDYMTVLAVNETLSEIRRRSLTPGSETFSDRGFAIPERFRKLDATVRELYARNPREVEQFFARKLHLRSQGYHARKRRGQQ